MLAGGDLQRALRCYHAVQSGMDRVSKDPRTRRVLLATDQRVAEIHNNWSEEYKKRKRSETGMIRMKEHEVIAELEAERKRAREWLAKFHETEAGMLEELPQDRHLPLGEIKREMELAGVYGNRFEKAGVFRGSGQGRHPWRNGGDRPRRRDSSVRQGCILSGGVALILPRGIALASRRIGG